MKAITLSLLVLGASAITKKAKVEHEGDFPHWMNGFGGYTVYKRDIPDRFEKENDDSLMKSMYDNYATEGKDKGTGKPNGHFWVVHDDAQRAAAEVTETHLHLTGEKNSRYVEENFPTIWNRFDVNEEGQIEIDRMPQFLRMICGSAEGCIGLQ